jgi:branched-chain amino acid transport system substrate-binding protein
LLQEVGNTVPYSGPASSYGVFGKSIAAYFKMINDQGGVNGRKIDFISRDDSYSPPKTVEQVPARRARPCALPVPDARDSNQHGNSGLPERQQGTATVRATGADKWNDPKHFPWTMGWQPSYRIEARIYARYILKNLPDAKIAVLYQNDYFGKDYLIGLREGLGAKAEKMIVSTQTYETSDPTVGIALNEYYTGDGAIIYRHACALGCEGMVSKRLGSTYRAGRSPHWLRSRIRSRPP